MRALLTAYEAFKAEPKIAEKKKAIGNYNFEFRQDQTAYFIFFVPKLLPEEEGKVVGGESELGRSVTYAVRKSDYTIIARQFYK